MAFIVSFFGAIGISLSPNATTGVHNNLDFATVFLGENALFVADRQRADSSDVRSRHY